ncbi:hypothetical protein ACWEO2_40275 [Nocardia sp. NPDC004278]
MVVNLAMFVIAIALGWAGLKPPLAVVLPLVWAFFPGSVPIGLAVAVWLWVRATTPVTFRSIDDERFVPVRAHPNFRAALQAMDSSDSDG